VTSKQRCMRCIHLAPNRAFPLILSATPIHCAHGLPRPITHLPLRTREKCEEDLADATGSMARLTACCRRGQKWQEAAGGNAPNVQVTKDTSEDTATPSQTA
jgi:hypothetical protein